MTGRTGQRQFGSIRKLPSGRYQARYRDRLGTEFTQMFERKADADAFLAETQTDLNRGSWRSPRDGRMLFSEFCERWLCTDLAKAATTRARDAAVIKAHLLPMLGGLTLAEITPQDVQAVVGAMSCTLAPKTVRTNAGVLRAILNAAVDTDRLYASPYRHPKLPPLVLREKPRLTMGEQKRLAAFMPDQYRIMVYLGGVLGLRFSEVVGLKVRDIGFLERPVMLRVDGPMPEVSGRHVKSDGKTLGSRKPVTVPQFLVEMLSEQLARRGATGPDQHVVEAPRGGPVHAANFRLRVWIPSVRAAGFEGLTFHGLRHSAAGVMRQVGASDQVVQERMRHTHRPTTTDLYNWVTSATDMAVVDALDSLYHGEDGTQMARRAHTEES
jgi:integrase